MYRSKISANGSLIRFLEQSNNEIPQIRTSEREKCKLSVVLESVIDFLFELLKLSTFTRIGGIEFRYRIQRMEEEDDKIATSEAELSLGNHVFVDRIHRMLSWNPMSLQSYNETISCNYEFDETFSSVLLNEFSNSCVTVYDSMQFRIRNDVCV